MKNKSVDTIIIGGGIAGLFAARKLYDSGMRDFLLITEDVGGRIQASEDGMVNYGAYFLTRRYKNLLPYVKFTRKMKKSSFGFVNNGKVHSWLSLKAFLSFPKFLKVFIELLKFDNHFKKYRKRCLYMSQKEAIEFDPYLFQLYQKNGSDVIHDLGVLGLVKSYFDQLGNFMSFAYPGHANGFTLMQWASEMILYSMYEFRLSPEKLLNGFEKKVITNKVLKIVQENGGYEILTQNGDVYSADYVILATEPWETRKLIDLGEESSDYIGSYLHHIVGVPKEGVFANNQYLMFPSRGAMISIGRQIDGTFLIYSDSKQIDLDKYFETYQVIHERAWDPAFTYRSYELIGSKYKDNFWIAGGINLEGMEECALTGIYAAKQVIKTQGTRL